MRCRCSIKRSRRRGRSPSKAAISSAAWGSTWRPFGVDLARFRPPPGCSNERTCCASWLIETSQSWFPEAAILVRGIPYAKEKVGPTAKTQGSSCACPAQMRGATPRHKGPALRRSISLFDQEHDSMFRAPGDLDLIAGLPDQVGNVDHRQRIGAVNFQKGPRR